MINLNLWLILSLIKNCMSSFWNIKAFNIWERWLHFGMCDEITKTFDSSISSSIPKNTNIIHTFESFDSAPASHKNDCLTIWVKKCKIEPCLIYIYLQSRGSCKLLNISFIIARNLRKNKSCKDKNDQLQLQLLEDKAKHWKCFK